jgi:hypothetical protein
VLRARDVTVPEPARERILAQKIRSASCPRRGCAIRSVYETFCKSDIEALLDCGIRMALGFDASHSKDVKPVHLELSINASHDQISTLRQRFNATYIKLKAAFMFGEGVYKLECFNFEQDIVDSSPKAYEIRKNRAIVRHGDVGGFVEDISWA